MMLIRTPYEDYEDTAEHQAARLALPVSPRRDHIRGPLDAHVTLLEYGDFECPYCGMAYPIVKQVERAMAGRLRVVFRHFPLVNVHPHAEPAAEAAEAAGAQGRFWEMHDQLFEHQQALDEGHLLAYAAAIGLDTDRFANELAQGVHAVKVREDLVSGITSGVSGTPSFFINDVRHDGSWDFDTLLAAVMAAERARADAPGARA